MSFTVLVVCTANVCRSPLAAQMLRESLAGLEDRAGLRVLDCGDRAEPGLPVCRAAQRWGAAHGLRAEDLAEHRSTRLDADLVRDADLVLTADRSNRAAVLRQWPTASDRTFTVREAAALSAGLPGRVPGLEGLVTELNGNRGLAGLPGSATVRPAARPWRRVEVHGHDVPDAHRGEVAHLDVRRHLVPAVEQVVDALRRVDRSS